MTLYVYTYHMHKYMYVLDIYTKREKKHVSLHHGVGVLPVPFPRQLFPAIVKFLSQSNAMLKNMTNIGQTT